MPRARTCPRGRVIEPRANGRSEATASSARVTRAMPRGPSWGRSRWRCHRFGRCGCIQFLHRPTLERRQLYTIRLGAAEVRLGVDEDAWDRSTSSGGDALPMDLQWARGRPAAVTTAVNIRRKDRYGYKYTAIVCNQYCCCCCCWMDGWMDAASCNGACIQSKACIDWLGHSLHQAQLHYTAAEAQEASKTHNSTLAFQHDNAQVTSYDACLFNIAIPKIISLLRVSNLLIWLIDWLISCFVEVSCKWDVNQWAINKIKYKCLIDI